MGIRIQKVKTVFIQFVIIFFVAIALGEIVFRLYNSYYPSFIFYNASYDRFRGKPFADDWDFKLNSQGFKDKEFSEKNNNVYRIIGIGDSFSFGVVPYKYNYLTLIESQLLSENINAEVLNMGIPSIGPKDYLSLLVKEGLNLQPNMILLSFFIGNDFYERKKLFEYSYIASFINYIINIRTKYEGIIPHGKAEYCDHCPNFDHDEYLKIAYSKSPIFLKENSILKEKQKNALYYLKEINNICKKNNIQLIVVIIPDELQINTSLQQEVKQLFYPNIKTDKWDFSMPNRNLSKELYKLNIDNIDLYEHFSKSNQQLYRPRDTHWNITGNKLATSIIQKYIVKYINN